VSNFGVIAPAHRIYIAGPMTYHPHFNFPAFIEAGQRLLAAGFDVVNPAELDSDEERAAAMASLDGHPIHYANGKTWGDFLARDVKLIADGGIEAVVCLPGWEKSRGARLETFVAFLCGLPIYVLWGDGVAATSLAYLLESWGGHNLRDDLDLITPGRAVA